MATVKLTTWNIEHLGKLLPNPTGNKKKRLDGIVDEIEAIDPDILCITEGPGNLKDLRGWAKSPGGLEDNYQVAVIPGTDEALAENPSNPRKALQKLYGMQGNDGSGNQWMWFLVKNALAQSGNAEVLDPRVWQSFTRQKTWKVHHWGNFSPNNHKHWRHPQTLRITLGDTLVEFIAVHLKSKINRMSPFDANGRLSENYINEALKARVKLATEAYDIRLYIERRFEQDPDPRIFVCGDMNDGPGREHFERQFLFFDVVSNAQGDVFFAKRFLNHALFDFAEHLRWTTNFHDRVEEWSREQPDAESLPSQAFDPTRFQLIDHILFTQGLVGEGASPRVHAHAGRVEHAVHDTVNAFLTASNQTSDHRPVSVEITV